MDGRVLLSSIAEAIYNSTECIVYIDRNNKVYNTLKSDKIWKSMIGDSGSLRQLFFNMFTKNHESTTTVENSEYSRFIDESFFERDNYQGRFSITIDEHKVDYVFLLCKINENGSYIIIRSASEMDDRNALEQEKMDTIQENYLFSMIVDLKEDTCVNPKTTEVSATSQDFMNIKYSEWRMMIVNMFPESEREMFLRVSSPEFLLNTLEEQPRFNAEIQMMNMTGQVIWVRLDFTRMKNFSRQNPRFVYTVKDVDKEMQRLLQQESIIRAVELQNEKLQKADEAKTVFFSSMSHEIRTPINAILGMNEVILRESNDENTLACAYDIKSAGKHLLSLVNDILDFSKIEAGKMPIVPTEYSPKEMIRDICIIISSRIEQKSLTFEVDVSSDIPKVLYGDSVRIKQIIINLLNNAVKYTQKGKVTFKIEPVTLSNGQFALDVSVKDTGIGIKEEDISKLFKPFERIEEERNSKIEGTGLGISIVTGLLSQMGSELKVESEYGKGSTFSFVVAQKVIDSTPMGIGAANRKTATEALRELDLSGKRILVVDDNEINCKIVEAFMQIYKLRVDKAYCGEDCLELIKENKYDLVFLDHMMPGMDGIETLRKIRNMGDLFENLPIIALTANDFIGARDKYISYGFTDYIEKPFTAKRIEAVIQQYLV